MDVLVRAVNSALFISHGIRKDTQIVVHLMEVGYRGGFFNGCELRGVRPDEIDSRALQILMKTPVPLSDISRRFPRNKAIRWRYLSDAEEWNMDGVEPYVLDAGGSIFESVDVAGKCGFVLSDDLDLDLGEVDFPLGSLSLGGLGYRAFVHLCDSSHH